MRLSLRGYVPPREHPRSGVQRCADRPDGRSTTQFFQEIVDGGLSP
jgi:hypothetical protein